MSIKMKCTLKTKYRKIQKAENVCKVSMIWCFGDILQQI